MKNVSLFYDITFSLFSTTFGQLLFNAWIVDEHVRMNDFCVNKSLSEVCMDLTACFYCCFTISDSPSSNLVSSDCVEMAKF